MFYSPDFLILRRNGKFAQCWLAALLTRKAFRGKFRSDTIGAIDVVKTCNELIIHATSMSSSRKFSLYLSSQLLLGVTRIYFYQTDIFLGHQWQLYLATLAISGNDIEETLGKKKRKKQPDLPLDLIQLPPVNLVDALRRSNIVTDEARITLREDDGSLRGYETMMEDAECVNFGALTAEQLDKMLAHDGMFLEPSESLQLRSVPEDQTIPDAHKVPLPIIDQNENEETFEIPDAQGTFDNIPVPEPVYGSSVLVETHPSVEQRLGTPTKHKLPPTCDVGTPSKIRRGLETEYGDDAAPVLIPILIEPAQPEPMPVTGVTSSDDISLAPLNASVLTKKPAKKKQRRLIVDENKQLSQSLMHQNRQNLFFQTRTDEARADIVNLAVRFAVNWLDTPSTSLAWGKPLLANYQSIILEPISDPLLNDDAPGRRPRKRPSVARDGSLTGVLRGPDTSEDKSGELTNPLLKQTTTSAEDTSKTQEAKTLDSIPIQDGSIQAGLLPLVETLDGIADVYVPTVEAVPLPEDTEESSVATSNAPTIVRDVIRDWTKHGRQSFRSPSARAIGEKSFIRDISSQIVAEDQPILGDDREPESRGATSDRFAKPWERADILGKLQTFWSANSVVDFKDLCPPSFGTRKIASAAFVTLLGLNKSKEVKLEQAEPYGNIYIYKYSSFC